jgi:hypothetical protein
MQQECSVSESGNWKREPDRIKAEGCLTSFASAAQTRSLCMACVCAELGKNLPHFLAAGGSPIFNNGLF